MGLFVLSESSAGYTLLKATDKKLLKANDIVERTSTPQGLKDLFNIKKFSEFDSAATALEEASAIGESKVTPRLIELLNILKDEKKVTLAVADRNLGKAIAEIPGLSIEPVAGGKTEDLFRAIRNNLGIFVEDALPENIKAKNLGLSHSLSRYKLKFSPEKVDVMIIHAVGTLDNLDENLNKFAMRLKEWYGWHFPEMAKIINDNLAYAKVVLAMGVRSNAAKADLAEVLPEDIELAIKSAAEISMGTDIAPEDLDVVNYLAEEVVSFSELRSTLSNYLKSRMQAMAPNLTQLVGELVGARLIAHAGSVMNLAKAPASTIQIFGAEKALFRALKTKHDTPKYGLIFHASLVGQASGKNKGKIARVLAAKAALGLRIDALAEWDNAAGEDEKSEMGRIGRDKVIRRLEKLEQRKISNIGINIGPGGQAQPSKFDLKETRKYNHAADALQIEAQAAAGLDEEDDTTTPAKKLIQEVTETNGDATMTNGTNGINGHDDDDEEDDDSSDDEEAAARAARKAAKKAEKAARKAEKAAKKEKKEKRKRDSEVNGDDESSRKKKSKKNRHE